MIQHNLSFDEYQKNKAISSSLFKKHWRESPAQIIAKSNPDTNDAMNFGKEIHTLILEPEQFDWNFVTYDGDRRKKAFKEFEKDHEGQRIISSKEADAYEQIVRNVAKDNEAQVLLTQCETEVSYFWDAPFGAKCKCRVDIEGDGVLSDVKTTGRIGFVPFANQVKNDGLFLQAGWNCWGWQEVYEKDYMPDFWFICIESVPPYSVVCRPMSAEYLQYAKEKAMEIAKVLYTCEVAGSYITLADEEGIVELGLPKEFQEKPKDDWTL